MSVTIIGLGILALFVGVWYAFLRVLYHDQFRPLLNRRELIVPLLICVVVIVIIIWLNYRLNSSVNKND